MWSKNCSCKKSPREIVPQNYGPEPLPLLTSLGWLFCHPTDIFCRVIIKSFSTLLFQPYKANTFIVFVGFFLFEGVGGHLALLSENYVDSSGDISSQQSP